MWTLVDYLFQGDVCLAGGGFYCDHYTCWNKNTFVYSGEKKQQRKVGMAGGGGGLLLFFFCFFAISIQKISKQKNIRPLISWHRIMVPFLHYSSTLTQLFMA